MPSRQHERERFLELAQEAKGSGTNWWAKVYRLTSPDGSSERRAVFFVYISLETGQYGEKLASAGPFRTYEEAVSFINDKYDRDDELIPLLLTPTLR